MSCYFHRIGQTTKSKYAVAYSSLCYILTCIYHIIFCKSHNTTVREFVKYVHKLTIV